MSPTVMSLADVARLLGVTRQRAHQLAETRGFPAPCEVVGRRRGWRRGDIEQFDRDHPRPGSARPRRDAHLPQAQREWRRLSVAQRRLLPAIAAGSPWPTGSFLNVAHALERKGLIAWRHGTVATTEHGAEVARCADPGAAP